MKKTLYLLSLMASSVLYVGCGDDDSSISYTPLEDSKETDRCLENLGMDESDEWSTNFSDSLYLKTVICENAVSYLASYNYEVECASVKYNDYKNRFDIVLLENGDRKEIWAKVLDCNFRLNSDAAYYALLTDGGYWTFNSCFCKNEDGVSSYRKSASPVEISHKEDVKSSSSENGLDDKPESSSSVKSSSSSRDNESSSSFEIPDDIIEVSTQYLNQKMLNANEYGTFLDERDNQLYRTIKIGSQVWMAQNLNYATENGNADDGIASWCNQNVLANCEKYGRLYSWAAAMNLDESFNTTNAVETLKLETPYQGLCPKGWHVPSSKEMNALRNYVLETTEDDETKLALHLRAKSDWAASYENGIDDFGFSVLPAGCNTDMFRLTHYQNDFWVIDESEEYADRAYHWYLSRDHETFENDASSYGTKGYGYSLRCIQD